MNLLAGDLMLLLLNERTGRSLRRRVWRVVSTRIATASAPIGAPTSTL
jgi:hypothetical protein